MYQIINWIFGYQQYQFHPLRISILKNLVFDHTSAIWGYLSVKLWILRNEPLQTGSEIVPSEIVDECPFHLCIWILILFQRFTSKSTLQISSFCSDLYTRFRKFPKSVRLSCCNESIVWVFFNQLLGFGRTVFCRYNV